MRGLACRVLLANVLVLSLAGPANAHISAKLKVWNRDGITYIKNTTNHKLIVRCEWPNGTHWREGIRAGDTELVYGGRPDHCHAHQP